MSARAERSYAPYLEFLHRNTACDYSYVSLHTERGLVGNGMTFTRGGGSDIVHASAFGYGPIRSDASQVGMAIKEIARRLVGREIESLFADMGAAWDFLLVDPQLPWSVHPRHFPRVSTLT